MKAGKVYPAFILQSMSAYMYLFYTVCHMSQIFNFIHTERFHFFMQMQMQKKIQLDQRSKASFFPLQHHKSSPLMNEFCHRAFPSPSCPPLLFSANCLISLICSNRILLSVFSGQTFHSTGGVSRCTFHLFLMAGPLRHWTREPSSSCAALLCRCTILLRGFH